MPPTHLQLGAIGGRWNRPGGIMQLGLILAVNVLLLSAGLYAQTPASNSPRPFVPSYSGCAMAHCDPQMSDNSLLLAPRSPAARVYAHDTLPTGSGRGLGCSSNGFIAVCSYNTLSGDNIVAYRADGTRLWTSGTVLSKAAYTSAPLIDAFGHVIAADDKNIVRFSETGEVEWITPTPGGTPISPILTASGHIVLATYAGPVSVYDTETGALLARRYLPEPDTTNSFYETINTPCAIGDRIYVSGQLRNDSLRTGRLLAIDINPGDPTSPVKIVWSFMFGAPSGASPTCSGNSVYFDAYSPLPGGPKDPRIFALRDDGDHPTLLWARSVNNVVTASFALDPRGGFWMFSNGYALLEHRSLDTGDLIESISTTRLINDGFAYVPASALTIAGTPTQPVLLLGVLDRYLIRSFVLAVDLPTRATLWKANLSPALGSDKSAGQFPLLILPNGKPAVVFTGWSSGAYFVGAP